MAQKMTTYFNDFLKNIRLTENQVSELKAAHKTNAANEELVISLIYGREVQDWKTIYRLLHHYTA